MDMRILRDTIFSLLLIMVMREATGEQLELTASWASACSPTMMQSPAKRYAETQV